MPESSAFRITQVNIRAASEAEYRAIYDLVREANQEFEPDEPPHSFEEVLSEWHNVPPMHRPHRWLAWDGNRVAAQLQSGYNGESQDNLHLLDFFAYVRPEYRGRGLARMLLPHLLELSRQTGRHTLHSWSEEHIPSGEAFLTRLGAHKALVGHENQLLLSELNHDLMKNWLANAPRDGFELGFWDGALPEAELETICELLEVMNTAPKGDLEIEDRRITPAMLRQWERATEARGNKTWTAYVRERDSGRFAGYTEIYWSPRRPHLLYQQGTGVFPEFRGHGLGRWLKAAMLERILSELPEAKKIKTGNADSNAPMLKINYELGFRPHRANASWQLKAEGLEAYLSRHP
ncbi:MAG: GNAT family N-acetyltransferase [Meiothermus sp.]|nr:GNAT family N-acetyltransferase [Meiothermus sp.]